LIEESEPQATLRKVTLQARSGDWFSFDPDRGRGRPALMSPLLATTPEHSHHRACDCVVLILRKNRLVAVYFELKSGIRSDYSTQFQSTRQFLRYAVGLLKEFHHADLEISEERYVVLHGGKAPPIDKRTTVPKREAIGRTTPNRAHKREVRDRERLYLKEFLE
jgi:hypothetical protein